jgi:hypothetical protein
VTARIGEIRHVGVEILAAAGAIVLRVEDGDVGGPSGEGIAEVVKGASCPGVAVGTVPAPGTGSSAIIAAPDADLGLG